MKKRTLTLKEEKAFGCSILSGEVLEIPLILEKSLFSL